MLRILQFCFFYEIFRSRQHRKNTDKHRKCRLKKQVHCIVLCCILHPIPCVALTTIMNARHCIVLLMSFICLPLFVQTVSETGSLVSSKASLKIRGLFLEGKPWKLCRATGFQGFCGVNPLLVGVCSSRVLQCQPPAF